MQLTLVVTNEQSEVLDEVTVFVERFQASLFCSNLCMCDECWAFTDDANTIEGPEAHTYCPECASKKGLTPGG